MTQLLREKTYLLVQAFVAVMILTTATTTTMMASSQAAVFVEGAGATLPFPLYSQWITTFQRDESQERLNYQPVGSREGIQQLLDRKIDFAASDIPLSRQQMKQSSTPILHIPTAVGAVAVAYNLKGIRKSIKLKPEVLADIFSGIITDWNDKRIADSNPGVDIPDQPIFVVHRSDGSGTTATFTSYLSSVSREWKKEMGSGLSIHWPVGLGSKGNEGIATLVKQTPGAIGYMGLSYAEKYHLSYAAVENREGEYRLPSVDSVSAAAEGDLGRIPRNLRISITLPKGKDAYPICTYTYLLIPQSLPEEKKQPLVRFLQWAFTQGQSEVARLHYSPLPPKLLKKVKQKLSSITQSASR